MRLPDGVLSRMGRLEQAPPLRSGHEAVDCIGGARAATRLNLPVAGLRDAPESPAGAAVQLEKVCHAKNLPGR